MAGKEQNNNVIADLNIRLGVITDATGLTKFVKDVQKTIDKATFNNGKKKLGYSNNFKVLEDGVKRYRKLLEETYKTAQKLSLTDNGGFKRNADGSVSDIEKAYKKLQKGLREAEGAFAKVDPTSLKMQNQMTAAQLRSVSLSEKLAKQEQRRKTESLRITAELNRHNTLLGGMTKKFGQLGSMARQYFNLWAVKAYLMNILNITAEFERQKRALGSLINDQAKAIGMFGQIKNMALNSPYTTLELTRTAKGLAAYDIETKDLIKDTKMLGDVASATGVDIQRLVLAYGQVKTATWLKGQEARQFSEAGVPILRALANRYSATEGRNVTTKEVQERMSNRQISFEDVQAALRAMTEEGGKFYNMQETIAETTYGKIQKITDAWQQGFERMANNGFASTLINGALDGIVKIAKNVSSIVPHLLAISAAILVINRRGKLTTKYAEKELALIERREMLVKQQQLWNNKAKSADAKDKEHAIMMSSYYGSQIPAVQQQLDKQIQYTKNLQNINRRIQENAQDTKFWNKRVAVLGLTFKRLGVTAKQVLVDMWRQLKAFATSNWVTLLIFGLVEVYNLIKNIGAKTRQLNNDLKQIENETLKKTNEMVAGFEKNAKIAVGAADGSKKQEDALSSLAQTYGEIIPLEQMSIENLKAMGDNYKRLTNQVKLYQEIEAGKEKRGAIIESDKYKSAFENGIKKIAIGWTTDLEGKSVREYLDKGILKEIQQQLKSEWKDESITNEEEYAKRIQKELKERGYTIKIEDIEFKDKAKRAFNEIKRNASTLVAEQKMYGVTGQKMIADQKIRNKDIAKELDNVKTGNEFFEKRNAIVEEYADIMEKNLSVQLTKGQAIAYLQGKMTTEEILRANQIDKNNDLYDKTMNTMTAMKNEMFGLFDGVNIYSERVEKVAELWKDQYITMKDMMVLLNNGDNITVDMFRKDRSSKQEAKAWLEDLRNQPALQESYKKSREEVNALLNIRNNADAEAYVRRYGINVVGELKKEEERQKRLQKNKEEYNKKISDIDNNSIWNKSQKKLLKDATTEEYNAKKEKENLSKETEWRLRVAQTTTFYGLGYLDDPKNNGGSGETVIGKWKRETNDWIGMLDKARQHYKELGDLFFDETALEKTVKAYEQQFKMYEVQFKDIMKQANITSLKEWISTEENYVKGLEAIITEVDKRIAGATGKDLKDLQEFRFFLSQKISNEQISNIKEAIKRFIEEVERQMETVSGRIDIWKNIFEKTNNTHLADMFAKTFSGSGSRDAIKTMRNGLEGLISKTMELPNDELDSYGKEILEKITNMFNSNVIDFSAIESLISNPQIPIEVRSQMLKIFKEFKQANQQILESGLEFYQKTRTLEEKRVDVFVRGQQRINEISKMQISNELKGKVMENVLKGVRSQMADLELEAIKSSDIYLTLFNNIEHAGVSSLKMLRDQIEALKDSFKDDPVKLKALNGELKKIDDKLEPKQYSFRDMFKIPSTKELNKMFNEIDEANAKVNESRKKTEQLQTERQKIIDKRETKRNSKETEKRIQDLAKQIFDEMPINERTEKGGMQYALGVAKSKFDTEIDREYQQELDVYSQKISEQIKETEELAEKSNEANRKMLEAEMQRVKAIEQMSKRIENAFKFSSNILDFGNSIAQSLTANAIFKGKNSDSNMMNVYANDVQSAFNAVKEYNNAFKGVMDSALNLWKDISGVIADSNGRKAINNRTPVDRNTSALLELTNAIYECRQSITGQSVPSGFMTDYKNDIDLKSVDKKKKFDWQMGATIGLGAGLSAANMIGSGDYRSGSKGMMSTVGSGLMSSGDPYIMAIGGALQLGSAIWDAADKIHDSDIEKAIENLQDKFDELSDVITETNNKIRKSTGNQVISGKRENIQTQQMQVKILEQQLAKVKDKKSSSDEEIKSYEKRIKELKQSIESAEMDLFESILGSGIDEYMKNLVNVFEEAAKSGENTFKALKNSFGESLSSMVQDTIMTTIIKNRLQKFFEQVEQISKQGGMGIGMTDDIIATGLEAMQDVNSDLKNMQPLIRQINTAFRVNSSTAGSLASGVKGMSEETAGQMSGYLIANFDRLGEIQKSVFTIEKAISGNTASGMMTQFQQDAITHLAQIEANTLRNANKLDQFYSLIDSMKVVNTNGSGAVYGIQTVN